MGKKVIINKEQLKKLYVEKKLSIKSIANVFGCSITPIRRLLKLYKIKIRNTTESWQCNKRYINISKKELELLYKKLSLRGVANKLHCDSATVLNKLKQYNLSSRETGVNIIIRKGEDSPSWEGGKSFEVYPEEFNRHLKEQIRIRDSRICQGKGCGIPELECIEKLTVHHIDYNKKNCSDTNLISLCRSCNSKVNFNRKYWEEYFTQLQISKIPESIKENYKKQGL